MAVFTAIAMAFSISTLGQQAIQARIIDTQLSQATDAVAKELRDGIAVIPSASIGGRTYSTSNTCIVMSAIGYDFSIANPLLSVTDTLVFSLATDKQSIKRTSVSGTGSKRPTTVDSSIVQCTDALFTFRVNEQLDWVNTSSSTTNQTFKLATVPAEQPSCLRSGSYVPCTWQQGSQTISVSVPTGASVVSVSYKVAPNASSCPFITSVETTVTRKAKSTDGRLTTFTHTTEARLRNKR